MIPIFDLHNFCAALPADVQRAFDAVSKYRRVPAGAAILRIGDSGQPVHQLVRGQVIYGSCDSRGRETITASMQAGDWIGLSEVFTEGPALADVIATTPVELRSITRRDFEALLDRHPAIARQLLKMFSLRFSVIYRLAQDQRELSLKDRLLKMLYLLAFRQNQPGPAATIRLAQNDLAKMLAASRQTLNRLLRDLEDEGLLTLGYRAIHLADRERMLRHYAWLLQEDGRPEDG